MDRLHPHHPHHPHKPGSVPLSLLCAICDRERKMRVIEVMESERAHFNFGMLGKGTANNRILNYLGLGATEKAVFFSIFPTERAYDYLHKLDESLHLDAPGHGIAFMTSIHEGCYHRVTPIVVQEETGGDGVEQTKGHDLIMVIVNRGYTEEVMDVARAAGAGGGTVLHARGCGMAGAEKFFGITIQPERELIMIVSDADKSCAIMQVIADQAGHESDAGAVSFSMPVNHVMGIGDDLPRDVVK